MTMKMRLLTAVLLTFALEHCSCTTQCDQRLKDSLKSFSSELKAVNLSSTDYKSTYEQICGTDGPANRFQASVKSAQGECTGQLDTFIYQLCEVRLLKLNTGRYTWTPTLLLDICNGTLPFFNADFFRHEQCIARVLNGWRSTCDREHYNLVKTSTGEKQCGHWKDFRECALTEVEKACGNVAANVSDYLLHRHASYFADYRSCGFSSEPYQLAMACWFERSALHSLLVEQLKSVKVGTAGGEVTTEDLGGVEPGSDTGGDEDEDGKDVKVARMVKNSATTSHNTAAALLASSFVAALFLQLRIGDF